MDIHDIVIQEEAIDDIRKGKKFYCGKDEALGDYFIQSIQSDIEYLKKHAGVHQRYFGFYRKLSVTFPYGIYYDIADNIAYVVAILPMMRNPKSIKMGLSNRH